MSFKDELTAKVNSVRKNIKTEAINYFIKNLKKAMRNTAEKGDTKGSIALRINFMEDENDEDEEYDEEYIVLRRLNNILLLEEEAKRTTEKNFEGSKIYEWLLKQIRKIDVFDNIYISLNIDTYEMEYFWNDEETEQ